MDAATRNALLTSDSFVDVRPLRGGVVARLVLGESGGGGVLVIELAPDLGAGAGGETTRVGGQISTMFGCRMRG